MTDYDGPIALWLGIAREMAGQAEAARFQWEIGLKLVERRLAVNASSGALIKWKGVLLALLGQKDESEKFLKLASEMKVGPREGPPQSVWVHARLLNGQAESVMNEIELKPGSFNFSDGYLRLDPFFDSLRANPRFLAFLAKQRREAAGGTMDVSERVQSVDAKSVAVLPFVNQSADKENEYFSDGIAEELLTVLQKIPGLKVAARTSAWSFKGKNPTTQEVGEKLGMAHVVEGSVQKFGTKVKITARLSRAATNEEVWSKSFGPLELTDVFATQSEIAQSIVAELRGRLTGDATATEIQAQVKAARKGGTSNTEAHQLYLQGKFFLNKFTLDEVKRAVGYFERALALDANFALAWAGLADANNYIGGYSTRPEETRQSFDAARRAVEHALVLEPDLEEALRVLGESKMNRDFDWKGAHAVLARARQLAPQSAEVAAAAAWLASSMGRVEQAIILNRQSVSLDPVNPFYRINFGGSLCTSGQMREAEAEYHRAIELSPQAPWTYSGLALCYALQGRFAEAETTARQDAVEWARLTALAVSLWGNGKKSEADAALEQLIARAAAVAAFQISQVLSFRRENDRAFEWLERAYRQRDPGLVFTKTDPWLRSLHADSRWPAFLRKIGLHDEQLHELR